MKNFSGFHLYIWNFLLIFFTGANQEKTMKFNSFIDKKIKN